MVQTLYRYLAMRAAIGRLRFSYRPSFYQRRKAYAGIADLMKHRGEEAAWLPPGATMRPVT